MARDSDNDVLLYTLDDDDITKDAVSVAGDGTVTVTPGTGDDAGIDPTTLFSINSRSGQLTTKVDSLNSDDDSAPGTYVRYTIKVIATDPSGAPGEATVHVTINDINDAPKIIAVTTGTGTQNRKALTVEEKGTALIAHADSATTLPTYLATDADADDTVNGSGATDTDDDTVDVTYAIEGADKGVFKLTAADSGVQELSFDDHTPNYEKQKEYSISIVVRDDSAPEGVGKLDVTVKVTNAEDDGTVTPTQREPQIGKEVVASLSDEDGNIRGQLWQWYKFVDATDGDTEFDRVAATDTNADNEVCTADSADLCRIKGATSPNYTPVNADEGDTLTARVTYTDGFKTPDTSDPDEDAGDSALVTMEAAVEKEDPANTAPKFRDDQDPNTPGDQPDAERSVPENANNANVGNPVTASDPGDMLIYSLSGADASSFKIDSGLKAGDSAGQIKTAMELDYETKDMYMVVVTATDPSGATDTINVHIEVTDEDDKTVIALGPVVNNAPMFDMDTASFSVAENYAAGASVGMVMATDEDEDDLTYIGQLDVLRR